jgi:hypothetical protein
VAAEPLIVAILLAVAALLFWRLRGRAVPATAAVIVALIASAFFIWIAGLRVMNPREIGWLKETDWQWHFLGWHLFRREAWHFPPGRIVGEFFPVGTALVFTDSLPLVAFLLKPISPLLPDVFQYLGIWLLVCYALQGICAALVIGRWTDSLYSVVAGATLVVLSPVLLNRVVHVALCSHWLLLLGFFLYFRNPTSTPRAATTSWTLLALIASLIHPYLCLMVIGLAVACAASEITSTGSTWRSAALLVLCAGAASVAGAWAAGWFTVGGADRSAEGFGVLSMNVLGPLAANGWSDVIPNIPVLQPQGFEGFNYLGAGAIALIAVAGLECARRPPGRRTLSAIAPLAVICATLAAYSLSNRLVFGSRVVAVIPLAPWVEALLGATRATGRFFWPAGYLVLLLAIAVIVRRYPSRWAGALLSAAVLLQGYDLHAQYQRDRAVRSNAAWYTWKDLSADPRWTAEAKGRRHIALVLPEECGPAAAPYWPLGVFAGRYGMTLNAGHAARLKLAAVVSACGRLDAGIAAGDTDPETIYVVHPSRIERFRSAAKSPLRCWPFEEASVCVR